MSEENIFSADQAPESVVENPPVNDVQLPPEVQEFVGEGKKYKSLQDALKSIPHAQSHIEKLEQELVEARTEAAKARAMDELLEEINKSKMQVAPQSTPASNTPKDIDINSAVEQVMARREAQKVAKENAQEVINAFQAKFGDQSEAQFVKLAQDTGLPLNYLNNLAQTSPKAVLKLAGMVSEVPKNVPHSTSTVKTEGQFNQSGQELSSRVAAVGATSKDVMQAWKNAGQAVKQKLS